MRHMKGQKYKRKEYLKKMGIREASETLRRRMEMMDIDNNWGRKRRCICGEKEGMEHIIKCKEMKGHGEVKEQWLMETDNIEVIRKVNRWLEEYINRREGEASRKETQEE